MRTLKIQTAPNEWTAFEVLNGQPSLILFRQSDNFGTRVVQLTPTEALALAGMLIQQANESQRELRDAARLAIGGV